MRKLSNIFLCFILLFFISCNKNEKDTKQKLSFNIGSEPQSLDPRKVRQLNSINIVKMFFEGLMKISKDESIECALAKDYTVSDDKKTYTFRLKDAFWSNNEKVTSYDFEYTYKKILSSDFISPNAYYLYVIKNGKDAKEGKIDINEVGIKTLDEKTLVIELENPCPYFLKLLTLPVFFAVNKNLDQKNPLWAFEDKEYVSNGPFKLDKWDHSSLIIAKKNPLYWDANQVKLEKISMLMLTEDVELNMFEMNQLDIAGSPFSSILIDSIPKLKKMNKLKIAPYYGTAFFRINSNRINDIDFRRALINSFDRKKIVDHILQGGQKETIRFVPSDDKQEINVVKKDFSSKKVTLTYIGGDRAHFLAQAIQRDWEDNLNIKVELRALEGKTYYEKIALLDYDIAASSWFGDFDDPIVFLNIFKYMNSSSNNTGWENRDYINLLNESEKTLNEKNRKEILKRAEDLLLEDAVIIPICHLAQNYLIKQELKNVYIHPSGNIDFKYAYLK
jgi:oligopeptide transport system substrate-binding protein